MYVDSWCQELGGSNYQQSLDGMNRGPQRRGSDEEHLLDPLRRFSCKARLLLIGGNRI